MRECRKKRNPFYSNRVAIYDIESFIALHPEKAAKKRWRIYKRDGYTCVSCGVVGISVVWWRERKGASHYDLLAIKNGSEVMMTMDHTVPKAKGGSNKDSNVTCMCEPCNSKKADKLPEIENA